MTKPCTYALGCIKQQPARLNELSLVLHTIRYYVSEHSRKGMPPFTLKHCHRAPAGQLVHPNEPTYDPAPHPELAHTT